MPRFTVAIGNLKGPTEAQDIASIQVYAADAATAISQAVMQPIVREQLTQDSAVFAYIEGEGAAILYDLMKKCDESPPRTQ
jgi:hypothetical protein